MLVSFSLQNYRSFASRQTISMVAGAGAKRHEGFSFPSGNSFSPHLLRSACLFGPNGAGKSALVGAFDFYKDFIVSSAKDTQEGEKINISPFKLDEKWRGKPTELEATFIHSGALYQYGFAVDRNRVWGEWLFCKPNAHDRKIHTLFQREYDLEEGEYVWSISKTKVRGEKEVWKNSTRDNALFLSTAIQLKAEAFKEPFNWIQNYLRVIETTERLSPRFTARLCVEERWKNTVLNLLRAVDIKIKDIEIDEHDIDMTDFEEILSDTVREKIKNVLQGQKDFQIKSYHHNTDKNLVALDFNEESDGSKVVFSIAGIWLEVLINGHTLVIDELHNSLHPHALKFLINLFHDTDINTKNAQLILTSHETSVMSKGFMHQDQVWLVENNEAEGSELIALSNYKVRDVSAFQKAYLDGRYGAVPSLREFVNA